MTPEVARFSDLPAKNLFLAALSASRIRWSRHETISKGPLGLYRGRFTSKMSGHQDSWRHWARISTPCALHSFRSESSNMAENAQWLPQPLIELIQHRRIRRKLPAEVRL